MITDIVRAWCGENNIEISDVQLSQLEVYAALLKEWNEKMNLTAITDDEGIAIKHFIDSISVLKSENLSGSVRIIDVGTGAGFPGIPLKITRPEAELTLLDSLNKRLIFLDEVCSSLSLQAQLIHSRAEDGSRTPEQREQYDVVISRAVAALPALSEYCLPYVKVGGCFLAMKGPDAEAELQSATNAINLLGGKPDRIDSFTLPDGSIRNIIRIKKVKSTPEKYPRRGTKINKNPL